MITNGFTIITSVHCYHTIISFHVGSGCTNAEAFYHAVVRARHVFDQAKALGYTFDLLDVGGGFNESSVVHGTTFEKFAAVLGPAVDEMFPSKNVRVIAEPGRYYVGGPAYTLCVGIVGRRTVEGDHNDGCDDQRGEDSKDRKFMCKFYLLLHYSQLFMAIHIYTTSQ